jgi:hypothetical protein
VANGADPIVLSERRDMSDERQRGVWIALAVAVLMAQATGLTVTAVLDVSGTLPNDIFTALTRPEPQRDFGGELIHCDLVPPTGVARGIQLALLGLLLGAVPAAMLSAALVTFGRTSRSTPWAGGWGHVFLAGFVFQVSSLGFSALLGLFLWDAREFATAQDLQFYGGFLGASLLCSVVALRFWRELQVGVHSELVTIAPVRHLPTTL